MGVGTSESDNISARVDIQKVIEDHALQIWNELPIKFQIMMIRDFSPKEEYKRKDPETDEVLNLIWSVLSNMIGKEKFIEFLHSQQNQ